MVIADYVNAPAHYTAADLFCGAGGTSAGLLEAAADLGLQIKLVAVNHWDVAIATHSENHPFADHYCASVEHLDPRKVVPDGYLRLLVASPECIYHSNARGGKPINDQRRTSPWDVLRWLEALYVEDVLIENVPEFRDWGPVDEQGKKIKAKKGRIFQEYLRTLRALGYYVDHQVLNAADYGDPTTRERLFIIARRKRRIHWPEPTHTRTPEQPRLDGRPLQPWRTARGIIDWTVPGQSIYNRKRPLADNTLRRIAAGLRKFSGLPFVLPEEGYYRGNAPRSVELPLPTVTASRGAGHLVQPFLIGQQSCAAPRSVDSPVPTVATAGAISLVQPFLLSIERTPRATQPGTPFIVATNHGQDAGRSYPLDEPMRTVTTVDAWAFVQPFLVEYHGASYEGGERVRSVDAPMPTVATANQHGLVQPYLVKYYSGGADAVSVDEPLPTVTTRDRFGLVEPLYFRIGDQPYMLDILFRMLLPHELAAAQGFRPGYRFTGKREDVVKQIGNAVPRNLARALCRALLQPSGKASAKSASGGAA